MGYSNYEKLDGSYCTRSKCPEKECKYHKKQANKHSSQSGIEYAVEPIYKRIDCSMASVYRAELNRRGRKF